MKLTIVEGWVCLAIAILFSVFGTISMKLSQGFRKLTPSLCVAVFYLIAFIAMTLALKHIELSTLYAVWSGVGTILTAAIGMIYFNESVSSKKIIYLLLIVMGVVGIDLSDGIY